MMALWLYLYEFINFTNSINKYLFQVLNFLLFHLNKLNLNNLSIFNCIWTYLYLTNQTKKIIELNFKILNLDYIISVMFKPD